MRTFLISFYREAISDPKKPPQLEYNLILQNKEENIL